MSTASVSSGGMRSIAAPFQHPITEFQAVIEASNGDEQTLRAKNSVADFRTHSFPALHSYSEMKQEDYMGPTTESNWVIPKMVLVGAYPATQDDDETFDIITSILKLGIKKFVCLQQEYKPAVPEELWRSGLALRPYFNDVEYIVKNKMKFQNLANHSIVSENELSFDHCPIVDCGITDDSKVLALSRQLVDEISRGQVIYLHCWGGHGRTGTVVSIMLHLMYGLSDIEAMKRCQFVHDLRRCPVDVGSPQTQAQRDQVSRIVRGLMQTYRIAPPVSLHPHGQKSIPELSDSQKSLTKPSKSFNVIYDQQSKSLNRQSTPVERQRQHNISRFPYFHYSANNLNQLKTDQHQGLYLNPHSNGTVGKSDNVVESHQDTLAKSSSVASTHSSTKSRKNSLTRKSLIMLKDQVHERSYSQLSGLEGLSESSKLRMAQLNSRTPDLVQTNASKDVSAQLVQIDLLLSDETRKIITEDVMKFPSTYISPSQQTTTNSSTKTTISEVGVDSTTITQTLSTARQSVKDQGSQLEKQKSDQQQSAVRVSASSLVQKIIPTRPTNLSTSAAKFGVANFMNRKVETSKVQTQKSNQSTSMNRVSKGKDFLNIF